MDLLKQLRQRRAWLRGLVVWWVALALTATALWPQSGGEYEVKAAFLYKFASFVEWPEATRHEPLGICVVGQDPFGSALERAVKGHTIGGREFVVRRLRAWRAGTPCHILFIAASEKPRLRSLLEQVQHQAILTVGDVPGFCESGGAINLSVVEARVKLEINPDATAKSGLQVSSKLLSLARTVHDPASAADGVRD